ncbi:MAG TPA: sigma 54-interacting transcriptional regulator, partial [Polyangiaceae bacterium]|nr:sigma 54-interacting transcriptional regulator [Polyangiaceae bacterium]
SLLPRSGHFAVEVIQGADRGSMLDIPPSAPSRLLVGQSAACSLKLSDPGVSRRHLALEVQGSALKLTDLRSTNGTYVNDVQVVEAYLRGGESVRIGETTLRVVLLGDEVTPGATGVDRFGPLIGASPQMRKLHPMLERLAASDVPVIIEGETGTGKEVVAEAIHERSSRAKAPFVVFDCTVVAPTLSESMLFGHERGSFTGAVAAHRGVFEEAHGGTLLIDEIGDLDVALQPKLLRAIQRSELRRVGGDRWLRVDVRVIASTRRDLDREVQAGRFRDDLFYRLNVARVELPPLRDRTGDVQVLSRYFWERMGGGELPIPYELFQSWEDYTWPGNVRELENMVARRIALGDLAPPLQRSTSTPSLDISRPLAVAREDMVKNFERAYLERVLDAHGGDVAKAAAAAGVGRRYFNMLRARYGV